MRLGRILHTSPERRTRRIGSEIQQLEVVVILLPKGDSGWAPSDRIDVELDRPIAERGAFEYCGAGVQSHQPLIEPKLPQELCVLFRLPVIGSHRDRDRVLGSHSQPAVGLCSSRRRQREHRERKDGGGSAKCGHLHVALHQVVGRLKLPATSVAAMRCKGNMSGQVVLFPGVRVPTGINPASPGI